MKNSKRILSILLICMMFTSAAFAANTSMVEYTTVTDETTGTTTVTATALATGVGDEEVKLFTAVYDEDGNLAGAASASTEGGLLLKNSVVYAEGQQIKSFAWEGDGNTPVEMAATYGKTDFTEDDVTITFGGKSFEEYTGSALAFDAEDNVAEYTIKLDQSKIGSDGNITIPYPEIEVKDNAMYYDVVNDEEALTTTISIMSGRTVTSETVSAKERELYAPAKTEAIVINYEWAMFTEDLVEEINIGFLSDNTYYNRSYTFDYSDAVTASEAIEGKTAVLSAITVDGTAIEGFSPDVFDYTVEIDAAATELPAIAYTVAGDADASSINPTEFPGETVITVTEGDVTNEYTIAYTCSADMVTELALGASVPTSAPKPAFSANVQVGDFTFADRTTFPIEYIAPEYAGLDRIKTCLGWGTDGTTVDGVQTLKDYTILYNSNTVADWTNFRVARGTTVIILDDAAADDYWTGWDKETTTASAPYMTATASNKLNYIVKYTKHFDAGELVSLPGYHNGGRAYTVLLKYDGWNNGMDITLHADTINKNTLVVLVPKDNTRDVIVSKNDDGTYSDVTWTRSSSQAISSYNYETDDAGNPIYTWDASRATGESANASVVSVSTSSGTLGNMAVKNLVFTDGQYVLGSRASATRYPLTGSHFLANMPDEYENANYIVTDFVSAGNTDVDYTFSVNDNLKKIVVLTLNDVANPTIGETTSVEATLSGDARPYYTYQSVQESERAYANLSISYQIAKGTMTANDVFNGTAFTIRRLAALEALEAKSIKATESKMSAELYAVAGDATATGYTNHVWFFGDLIFAGGLVTDLDLTDNIKNMLVDGKYGTMPLSVPEIRTFSSGSDEVDTMPYSDSNTLNMPGLTISYPQWIEAEYITYIAPSYTWSDVPSNYTFGDEVFVLADAVDMYSFKVTEDVTLMMFTKDSPDNFWALSDGWTKTALTGGDRVVLNRQIANTNIFTYTELYTKDVTAGTTVTIKTPQAKQILPLVFVKTADR